MRLSRIVAAGALVSIPALATAEIRSLKPAGSAASYGEFVAGPATIDDLRFARQVLPPVDMPPPGASALALSKTVYLNKNGVTLQPGTNDARTNRSSIATQTTTIAPWTVSATTWAATVTCMKDLFSAYDINIVEQDPGTTVPHIEAVFGGAPGQLGMDNNVAGVSPFTTNCGIIENSIVFTFTDVIPADARLACEIMAQEVAHSYGLDHELLASDPMTYLNYSGNRSFQNQTASCGESTARPCGIGGSTCRTNQNSVALLTERLGRKGGDTVPPTANISSPSAGATVPPGFDVYANANDNAVVTNARLFIDGTMSAEMSSGPFKFTTSATLAEGLHRLKIEVTDGVNVVQTQEITVTVKKGATPPTPPGTGTPGDTTGGTDEITGGCSTGGSAGGGSLLGLGLALIGLVRRRR